MSYLDYGAYVRVVLGDPWALRPNQYAFEEHHDKFSTHVQELRDSPQVPFVHGFTMPTVAKDAETNACFKQLLLRPHACPGLGRCLGCDATQEFCAPLSHRQRVVDEHGIPDEDAGGKALYQRVRKYSYLIPWRLFEAEQRALAERADAKIQMSSKQPVLQDSACLRCYWLPGVTRRGSVHEVFVPLLRRCLPGVPEAVLWAILRFAGFVRDDDGGCIGVAGTLAELESLQRAGDWKLGASSLKFTSPGYHDEQLTLQEFWAWRRVEYAERLELMAEARGRPRPGKENPDAVPDDPDGVHGGEDRDVDAKFDGDEAVPGASDAEDLLEVPMKMQADPQLHYEPRHKLPDAGVFDTVHRLREARVGEHNKRSPKRGLFEMFLREHDAEYREACKPQALRPAVASGASQNREAALKHQNAFAHARQGEETATTAEPPEPRGCKRRVPDGHANLGVIRELSLDELPISPKEMAAELIARSGVWQSKEQYLTILFVLQPLQTIWERALADGKADDLKKPGGLSSMTREMSVRRLFLHGPGGSGKTYCMTEVVAKIVRHFLGRRGLKAIAASNSAARLLLGKTMHQAGKMRRQQSLKAKHLKPDSRARKALETEWADMFLLLGDELSLASPPLLAGISRRAFHGRARPLRLRPEEILERTFGDVPVQVLMGDFLQLNPVKAHTLLEALCTSRVPGVPNRTTEEDKDGYSTFRSMCSNVVLFKGTHRFLDADLPALLEIMRTPGGKQVPPSLRKNIARQIQAGPGDPRIQEGFVFENVSGFFCYGAHVAIQWEQVMRMTQLHVLRMARQCQGPRALQNTTTGEPCEPPSDIAAANGQLVYYFQRVDRFKHQYSREQYEKTLRGVNLSKSAGLHGVLGLFVGMRVRLTKKVLAPELVQEAPGEVVFIQFHPDECFGHPTSSSNGPAATHTCWGNGWVLCDDCLCMWRSASMAVAMITQVLVGLGSGDWNQSQTRGSCQLRPS